MFGSTNPFGQSSSPLRSSQSVFGSQTGNSMFGGSSTGVFGATQASSPFSSNTTFRASSLPAFGSSTPSFGAPSTPAFGNSSFGGSPLFGQKPAFGGFGSTPTQTSPFGSATQPSQPAFGSNTQQSQPAFGSSIFGSSTPFGASSQPAFGSTGTPAFGATSTPAFGATSTPAFGATSTPAFGSTTTPAFGSTGSAFGMSNTSVFGGGGAFGASSSAVFGSSSTPAFGVPSSPAFGASSTPAFSFGSSTQAFGPQTPTQAFGNTGIRQSGFGGQRGGSRVASYSATAETDGGSAQPGRLESISAMPVYKDKSHEDLRWEDYQLGDKGGPLASPPPSTGMAGFRSSTTQTNAFSPSPPAFGQSSANPFSSTTPNSNNPFAPKTSTFSSGFGTSAPAFSSPAFGSSTSAAAPSIFGSPQSPFGANSSSQPFGSSPSLFGNNTSSQPFVSSTTSPFGSSMFGNTQSSPLFNSSAPTNPQSGSTFGQNTSPFGKTGAFSQPSLFNPPLSGLVGSIFSNSASVTSNTPTGFGQTALSLSTPFQTAQPAQSSGTFSFSNFGQTQPAGGSSFSGTPGMFCQNNFGLQAIPQNSMFAQPAPINTNPFRTLHALPQMSIGRVGNTPSVQYRIFSMPVQDKPAPVRISPVLTARHLSQRRIKFPLRKYKNEGSRVPIFSNDDDTPTTPKADALLIPRENPRALIICPMDQWPGKASEKASSFKDRHTKVNENGTAAENGVVKEQVQPVPTKHASNRSNGDHSLQKADMYKTLGGHIAGEASIVYEHGADVEALMPKLQKSDYLTLPRIHELAAMETAEPGFCSHVKDFVVGRQGYGSIRFLGVTDVRGLDLESIVQFDIHKVIVYPDDSKKPPVGQGLNKPAEVTLLNIKYFDKKTGQQYTGGPRIDKYKEMLKRMAKNQGAEFVSYDANKGEWKFKVKHFSSYEHETTLSESELVFDPNCSVVISDYDDLISNGVIIMGIGSSESSVLHASFFPFEDSRYKVEDLERLRDLGLQCPQIIMPFQVVMSPKNQRYLIAEDLQSVQKMFGKRYKDFLKHDKVEEELYCKMEHKEKGDAIKRWWGTIERDFFTIFRDVVKGLMFQNKKQNHGCGNLGQNIFVRRKKHSNEYEAKILPLMDASVNPYDDIMELVNTMQTIIFPPSWKFDFQTDQSSPCLPLRKYITFLIGFANLTRKGVCLYRLVDHPYLWTSFEKVLYMKEMGRQRKVNSCDIAWVTHELTMTYFSRESDKWKEYAKGDPLLNAIMLKPDSDPNVVSPYKGASEDILRFFIAVYSHANDREYRFIRSNRIEERLSAVFPNIYSQLKYCVMICKSKKGKVFCLDNILGIMQLL